MTITVLSDVVLPNTLIAAGLAGRNIRSNTRAANQGGYGSVNVNWTRPLREYDLGFIPSLPDVWQTIEGLWEITKAGAYGFLMEDPKDCAASLTQGVLQAYLASANVGPSGFGYGVPAYRLYKRYPAYGSVTADERHTTRPVLPLSALKRAGVDVVLGASAGQAAISGSTVTFVADATLAVSSVTVGATTIIELVGDLGLAIGGRLWLEDLTGADAALLNNQSHSISNLVGNIYTLATDTTGATITVGGNGKKYPQPTEALTWSGRFHVPVHFRDDELPWVLVRNGSADQRLISGQSIVLQEVRET